MGRCGCPRIPANTSCQRCDLAAIRSDSGIKDFFILNLHNPARREDSPGNRINRKRYRISVSLSGECGCCRIRFLNIPHCGKQQRMSLHVSTVSRQTQYHRDRGFPCLYCILKLVNNIQKTGKFLRCTICWGLIHGCIAPGDNIVGRLRLL